LNIELKTLCEVQSINGEAGNFEVELLQHPRYVDMDKCIACGACAEKCPKKVTDDFNAGLDKRKAIYVDYAQAVPLKYAIDEDNCIYIQKDGRCGACIKVCPADAIDFEQKEEKVKINVGSVVVAPGFSAFDPKEFDTYQYTKYPNVITSLEMERILSATGPYHGHLVRPSDNKEPKKIAWLQCIGSRDNNRCDNGYCSSVCCMYAVKEAVIAKEHAENELDTAIFFMDMRTYGKEFESYYNRAKDEKGVRFVRTRIHSIIEDRETRELHLRYVDEDGTPLEETFDMVVLSVGMETPKELVDLAGVLDIELTGDNFARTSSFSPVKTSRDGIYVCGAFQEPKDIPYSVMEASAAACWAESDLSKARGALTKTKTYPEQKDLAGEDVKIGVFVCNCGTNIGAFVNVPEVAEMAKTLPGVTYVEENLFTCSQDSQDKIRETIKKEGLNRVVVAACTPRTHEELFQETLQDAGLNKYLFEMANIRNQCSWVHSDEKEEATAKAKDLVRMSVARSRLIKSLGQPSISVDHRALVIGGGIAGMTAALGLADQGYAVHLIEEERELGGNARSLLATWQGDSVQENLEEMTGRINTHDLIDVYTQTTIKESTGFIGNFKTTVTSDGNDIVLEHGVVIMATGAREYVPTEYLYGQDDRVMTHLDLDRAIQKNEKNVDEAKSVVFVQCVGSREEERPYCSKVCCTHSVKAAIGFKERNPETNVFILYRDIRTYGLRERLFQKARGLGVIFIRYDKDRKPAVRNEDGQIWVKVKDHVVQMDIDINADLIVLASAIVPRDNEPLTKMFKLSCSSDNFFNEAHAKLRPVEFATAGVFLAGMAHYPKPVEESIAQAAAAASRAAVTLSKDMIVAEGVVSNVREFMCRACGECEKACPFNAIAVGENKEKTAVAIVQEALCKGCGMCAVACPTGAASVYHFDDDVVLTMVEEAFEV
jgi:heterodisulfide reductase subunit A